VSFKFIGHAISRVSAFWTRARGREQHASQGGSGPSLAARRGSRRKIASQVLRTKPKWPATTAKMAGWQPLPHRNARVRSQGTSFMVRAKCRRLLAQISGASWVPPPSGRRGRGPGSLRPNRGCRDRGSGQSAGPRALDPVIRQACRKAGLESLAMLSIRHQPQTLDLSLSGIRPSTPAFMPERTADQSMREPRETTCR
jgi:hypothetical protein